jgi:primosomal protein N'
VTSDINPGTVEGLSQVDQLQNQVKLVDKSYLERSKSSATHKKVRDGIVQKYRLNYEQERAFKIVTSHVSNPMSEQLKMYIGGMGGTGKTQVLKAIVEFFNATNQSGWLVVAAPTGTAAALLGG